MTLRSFFGSLFCLEEWRVVGTYVISTNEAYLGKNAQRPDCYTHVKAIFLMTDSGKRKVKYLGTRPVKANSVYEFFDMKVQLWVNGGPFPSDKRFTPVDDTLGEMLNRLVNNKMGIGQEK